MLIVFTYGSQTILPSEEQRARSDGQINLLLPSYQCLKLGSLYSWEAILQRGRCPLHPLLLTKTVCITGNQLAHR